MLRKVLIAITFVNLAASVASSQQSSVVDGDASLRALQDSYFTDQEDSDLNGDGIVDFLDLGLLRSRLLPPDSVSANSVHGTLALAPPNNVLFFSLPGQSTPISQVSVTAAETLFLDLHMSFNDTTVGGGIDLLYDSGVLSFIDGVFDDLLGDNPNFRCPTDQMASNPVDCTPNGPDFVSFGGLPGITGDKLVVTLEFAATATGSSSIEFAVTSPFSDTMGSPIDVPEPSSGGLAAIAVLGVVSWRRRIAANRARVM